MGVVSAESVGVGCEKSRERAAVIGCIAIGGLRRERAVIVKLERIVAVIGDSAVDLMRGARQGRDALARLGLGHGDLTLTGEAIAQRARRLPGQEPADLELAVHLRGMVLRALKAAARLAELNAFLGIRESEIERRLPAADKLRRFERGAPEKQPRRRRPSRTHFADDGVGIDLDALERDLPQGFATR